MSQWLMLSLTGEDRPGIVARVTTALFEAGCILGEASMMRLGSNFSMMLMLRSEQNTETILKILGPVTGELGLHVHLDPIEGGLHQHQIPDVRITVHGADRAGIVSQVTTRLASAGLNILDLESDVAGTEQKPIYIMVIEGIATKGLEAIEALEHELEQQSIDVRIEPIQTYLG
jgi:glycine cleavage system transcriptional repressor